MWYYNSAELEKKHAEQNVAHWPMCPQAFI